MDPIDLIGTLGAALVVGAYLMLQLQRLDAQGLTYSLLNAIGALLLVISLLMRFNLGPFLVEFFWLLISLFGVWKYVRRRAQGS